MKRVLLIVAIIVLAGFSYGCGRKQQSLEQMQEPMSMEALSNLSNQTQAANLPVGPTTSVAPADEAKLEPLPPEGPYKPSPQEIQTALKNAGYYNGVVDGKIGPVTKRAIKEFQQANGLGADGKVGPKTWTVLSKYLNPEPAPLETKKSRIR